MAFIAKSGSTFGTETTGRATPRLAYRSLVGHCLDVAVAFDAILGRSPNLTRPLDLDTVQRARLYVLAGIHDFGKARAGWQAYIRGGPRTGHVAPTLAAIMSDEPLVDVLDPLLEWTTEPVQTLHLVICHHGAPVPKHVWEKHSGLRFDAAGVAEVARVLDTLMETFPSCRGEAKPIDWTPERQHLIAGLLMMSDWIGSSLALVDEPVEARRRRVAALLDDAGFRPHAVEDPDMGMSGWRPMQAAVGSVPLEHRVLIEDMTGSGKTEASIRLALRYLDAELADGVRFCVPTRSAASELHGRISDLMGTAAPSMRRKIVLALSGELATDGFDPAEEGPRSWAISGSRKTGVAPVAVGTIDQALLGTLRVRHAWARRSMDARSVLIVDEVHAGDPYMLALVERLAASHPGPMIMMSATLGTDARQRLLKDREGMDAPYPAIWAGPSVAPIESASAKSYAVEVTEFENAVSAISAAVRAGALVLVVRSTIADALHTRDRLRDEGLEPLLHHSRYAKKDRLHLDGRVLGLLGKHATRARGAVVVGTQTVEQSLDIDADLLVTDACPADVFLQRAGRCHRHDRDRIPDFPSPKIVVIDPGDPERFLTGDPNRPQRGDSADHQGWPWVYPLPSVVSTVEWLKARGRVRLPEDAREFVDWAISGAHLEFMRERGASWAVALDHGLGKASAARRLAEVTGIDLDQPYGYVDEFRDANLVDPEEVVTTRLGQLPVPVLTPGLRSPFTGELIDSVPMRVDWLPKGATFDGKGNVLATVDGDRIEIDDRSYLYAEDGLHRSTRR